MADNRSPFSSEYDTHGRVRDHGFSSGGGDERLSALAYSQEVIIHARDQADSIIRSANEHAEALVREAEQRASEIVREAERKAGQLLSSAGRGGEAGRDRAAQEQAVRCVEACMAALRRQQEENLAFLGEQWQHFLSGLPADSGPSAPPRADLPPEAAEISPEQIEQKVSAIAGELAALLEDD